MVKVNIYHGAMGILYASGATVSYYEMKRPNMQIPEATQELTSQIAFCSRVSYQQVKDFYATRLHPVIYTAGWPVIMFSITSLSLFTGSLTGYLTWKQTSRGKK
jgi:hypothetical protein